MACSFRLALGQRLSQVLPSCGWSAASFLHDAVQQCPPNLRVLIGAQHDRDLECHQKLWDLMAAQPLGQQRELDVPRSHGQPARTAVAEVRWAQVSIEAPTVGRKKGWPALPQLPATVLYTPEELKMLLAAIKKMPGPQGAGPVILARSQSSGFV
jgi:hypothetical protein